MFLMGSDWENWAGENAPHRQQIESKGEEGQAPKHFLVNRVAWLKTKGDVQRQGGKEKGHGSRS